MEHTVLEITLFLASLRSVYEGCSVHRAAVTDVVHSGCYTITYQSAGSLLHVAFTEYKRALTVSLFNSKQKLHF